MPFDREFKNPALILGGDSAGLWSARILGRKGVDVYIVTDNQKDVALSSKYCKKTCHHHAFELSGFEKDTERGSSDHKQTPRCLSCY